MVVKFRRRSKGSHTLSANYDWKKIEPQVRAFYEEKRVRRLVHPGATGRKAVGYVEGPPTLNNQPHIGHVRGRTMKDLWYRYMALDGVHIVFRGGWDTQGLPVELQAEKEMGLTGNKWEDLNRVGVEKLVEGCKRLIAKYRLDWEESDALLGIMIDHDRDYMTYRDEYIEREWKYLETAWKQGLLGEGYKVVPYCPSCQTALSHAEVVEGGYEQLEDPSLYFKVKAADGAYLALWTTMPFTVVTDELVGVKPDSDYEYVKVGAETWVVNADRKEALSKELGIVFGETMKRVKGSQLEGLSYTHPLLSMIPGLSTEEFAGKVHRVVAEDFVDTTTGTGLVHMAPANGEDDFAVASKRGIPVFAPFDDRVKFTPEAGKFEGLFARDADKVVVEALRGTGALISIGVIRHDYPVCWRSGHRLVWLARREYFYWVDRLRGQLTRAAKGVEYFFDAPMNRFLSFISESPPWCISRERVWGTPLPIWVCEQCGEKTGAFSRKEIVKKAVSLPDGRRFELHKPWIDRVVLRCQKCGGNALREPFVLDTWHNSGSAPYASFTDEENKRLVPVGFLTEAIDQTRGWAYTLLVLNVILTGKPQAPYRDFLFQGHVLDSKGQKMSKSLGNVVWGLEVMKGNPVDVVRYYLVSKASPEDSVSFDPQELTGRAYQVLSTLYHLHVYLVQNGEADGYDSSKHTLGWARKKRLLTPVDKWLLAKLAAAQKRTALAYGKARFNEAAKTVEELVINHLSQSYVRLVRSELWKDDPETADRRLAIYAVLGTALRSADSLLHPVSPFATEYLFQEVFSEEQWRTPLLLLGWGERIKEASKAAEKNVDFALTVEEACNSARTKGRLKRRWPLATIEVLVPPAKAALAQGAKGTIASLCNVKQVRIRASAADFPAKFVLRADPARVGALFKEKTMEVLAGLRTLESAAALKAYSLGKPLAVQTATGRVRVPLAAFRLSVEPEGGYEIGEKDGVFVAVSTARDAGLIAEGLVRDLARRLQALRKERGFVPTALLRSAAVAGLEEEDIASLEPLKKDLAFLVRVKAVELNREKSGNRIWKDDDLDGSPIFLDVG